MDRFPPFPHPYPTQNFCFHSNMFFYQQESNGVLIQGLRMTWKGQLHASSETQ